MKICKNYINGAWVESVSGKTAPTYNPANGEILAEVVQSNLEDVELAVAASQNVLAFDESEVRMLEANGEEYAFQFIRQKISDIEITPSQLALDPCSASCVVTDVNTGEVKALVTYPSYDNNKFSGSVDAEYYSRLNNDLSLPLFNNATQAQKAPGSTFKPIIAVAALEEGAIRSEERRVGKECGS